MSDEKILMKDNSEDEEKEEEEKMNHDDNDILMRSLLLDSVKREKNLQRLLDNEILKNDQLRMELELERKKKKDVILKDDSDSDEASERALGDESTKSHEDLKETFGTNSTILMQYKYDELQEAYSRCVKKLCRRSKQLKQVLQEAELEKFKNIQLSNENIELNKKIEDVCHRFLKLVEKRNEEKIFYISQLKKLKLKVVH